MHAQPTHAPSPYLALQWTNVAVARKAQRSLLTLRPRPRPAPSSAFMFSQPGKVMSAPRMERLPSALERVSTRVFSVTGSSASASVTACCASRMEAPAYFFPIAKSSASPASPCAFARHFRRGIICLSIRDGLLRFRNGRAFGMKLFGAIAFLGVQKVTLGSCCLKRPEVLLGRSHCQAGQQHSQEHRGPAGQHP